MALAGCENSTNPDTTTPGSDPLPQPSGTNEVAGKSFFEYDTKTTFAAASGSSGSYTAYRSIWDDDTGYPTLTNDGKYTWKVTGTGSYSWNGTAKTVTLKPETIMGWLTGTLLNRTQYRAEIQAEINAEIAENGLEDFNQMLATYYGGMTVAQFIEYIVNQDFANRTFDYTVYDGGKVLLMQESLPASAGANPLNGNTYQGITRNQNDERVADPNVTYTFTATDYTRTDTWGGGSSVQPGTYSWNASTKTVYLRPTTIDGKTMTDYYDYAKKNWTDNRYDNSEDYWASESNGRFSRIDERPFDNNRNPKTIGWWD